MAVPFDYWLYVIIVAGAFMVSLVLLFAMKAEKGKKESSASKVEAKERWPSKGARSVTTEEVRRAQGKLKVLDVEREILSSAIRGLYEAEAEGRISTEERDHLAGRYKERMDEVKHLISRGGSVVALHELEGMQEDLIKLFSDRFDELSEKIEELRTRLEVKPPKEAPVPSPAPPPPAAPEGEEKQKPRRPRTPRKTEAEERIEKIRSEVEKVLERLGQIEAEE